jgi:hypothetical protein
MSVLWFGSTLRKERVDKGGMSQRERERERSGDEAHT